jgi:hypothetical protein
MCLLELHVVILGGLEEKCGDSGDSSLRSRDVTYQTSNNCKTETPQRRTG